MSGVGNRPLVTPNGWTVTDDGGSPPTLQLVNPSGLYQFQVQNGGAAVFQNGNNATIGADGTFVVYGTQVTAAAGSPSIMGSSRLLNRNNSVTAWTWTPHTASAQVLFMRAFAYVNVTQWTVPGSMVLNVSYVDETGGSVTNNLAVFSMATDGLLTNGSIVGTGTYYAFLDFPHTVGTPVVNNVTFTTVVTGGSGLLYNMDSAAERVI